MVRIDNITANSKTASCRFYPENKIEFGTIEIDVVSGAIISSKKPENGCAAMYVAHARSKLHQLISSKENLPKEAYAIWF